MELKQIKELMAVLEKSKLKKIHIKEKTGFEITLEKPDEQVFTSTLQAANFHPHPPMPHHHAPAHAPQKHTEAPAIEGKYITAPMVGTFFAAASPDDSAFVKKGDTVQEGTVVCIIEAMKVMNEVKADKSGVIEEVLVQNGHPVEFGSKLFRIRS